ncbi:MAG: hypothetical protein JWO80_4942 [Bryobacterales bacterium]|nr:hypothetical protein [Bryobacterales bacterium]
MFRYVIPESLRSLARYGLRFFADGCEELTGSPLQIVEQAGASYRLGLSAPRMEILAPPDGEDESLPVNSGLVLLNKRYGERGPRTVIVVGHARSGTSMIARALHIAGLPMGLANPVASNYEDKEFVEVLQGAIERPPLDIDRIDELIRDRNSRHSNWGFKAPAALHSLPYLLHHTRNPHIVAVFRDTLATSVRERLAVNADLWESFESIFSYETLMLTFLRNTDVPCLLVSYEKALLNPRSFCKHLARFAMLEADPTWIEGALREMNPDQRDYVEEVRDVRRFLAIRGD